MRQVVNKIFSYIFECKIAFLDPLQWIQLFTQEPQDSVRLAREDQKFDWFIIEPTQKNNWFAIQPLLLLHYSL